MSYEKVADEFPSQPVSDQGQPPSTTPMQQFPPYVPPQPPPPYPPTQPQPVPMNQYYPAPSGAVYPPQPQQQQSSNVVVVSSQPAPSPVIITHQPHAPDFLILTIVGFILCFFFGGVVGMLLLIPALICSIMAQDANSSGDYENAKNLGRASLIWNICVYIFYTVVIVVLVVVAVVLRNQAYAAAYNICVQTSEYPYDC